MAKRATRVPDAGDPLPDVFDSRLIGPEREVDAAVVRYGLDVGCRHGQAERVAGGRIALQIFASEATLGALGADGLEIERGENVSALGRERQSEIGKGDRFEGGKFAPTGLGELDGRPMPGSAS